MMMKLMCFLVMAGIFFPGVTKAGIEKVVLKGEVKGVGNDTIVLLDHDFREITRTMTSDDRFSLVAELETGDMRYYHLYFPSVGPLTPSMTIPYISLFVDAREISIKAELSDNRVSLEEIKGSPGKTEYDRIWGSLSTAPFRKEVYDNYNRAFDLYNNKEKSDENYRNLKEASRRLSEMQSKERREILSLQPSYRKSRVYASIAAPYFNQRNVEEAERFWLGFDPSVRDCPVLRRLEELFENHRNSSVGHKVPELLLPDMDGKEVALTAFLGKFVLLDFWASWCGPCRREMAVLREIHDQFADKGLQVIGISLDKNVKQWKDAVSQEGLKYLQLIDSEGLSQEKFDFNGIPFMVLVSPEGRIMCRDLRGEKLRTAVADCFK